MDYAHAVNYIEAIPKFTDRTGPAHARALLDALGDPERGMRLLHVAGTNGKGSVCAYLQAALTKAGLRVGSFTSPHLIRLNERIRIDGEPVSDADFAERFSEVLAAARQAQEEGASHPTYFEFLFLMAMRQFALAHVDVAILEVGLGGRLDATNAIRQPAASVITAIGLDHTKWLGGTIEEIAAEKAGILKPGVPVYYEATNAGAAAVILARAGEVGCDPYPLLPGDVRIEKNDSQGIRLGLRTGEDWQRFSISQRAAYQVRNAALAARVLLDLADCWNLRRESVFAGLFQMRWPGRMQEVRPGVFVDGAHNPDGVEAFLTSVMQLDLQQPVRLLFAASADKPYEAMARRMARGLCPTFAVATEAPGGRAAPASAIAQAFSAAGVEAVRCIPDPTQALKEALRKQEGTLLCAGSLYLAGFVLEQLAPVEKQRKNRREHHAQL